MIEQSAALAARRLPPPAYRPAAVEPAAQHPPGSIVHSHYRLDEDPSLPLEPWLGRSVNLYL